MAKKIKYTSIEIEKIENGYLVNISKEVTKRKDIIDYETEKVFCKNHDEVIGNVELWLGLLVV